MTEVVLTSNDKTEINSPDPNRYQIDGQLGEVVAGLGRVRFFARLAALAFIVTAMILGGLDWLAGAVLGGLVVELNFGILNRSLCRAVNWKRGSLWPTLLWFYLTFGVTVVVCVLAVRYHWGHPLAFLMGLASFFMGLVLALLSFIIKPVPGQKL